MFELLKRSKDVSKNTTQDQPAKKLNIYRVVTSFVRPNEEALPAARVDLVRAKTKQGAKNFVADMTITVSVATQDDLLLLAGKVKVLEAVDG